MLVKTEDGNYLNILGCHLIWREATESEKEETNCGNPYYLHVVTLVPLEERLGQEKIIARVEDQSHAQELSQAIIKSLASEALLFEPGTLSGYYCSLKPEQTED